MNKKGWIRILEAVIAVLIVMSVLIVVYVSENRSPDLDEAVSFYHEKILKDISLNKTLRISSLKVPIDSNGNEDINSPYYVELNESVKKFLTDNFGFSLRVCKYNAVSCNLNTNIFIDTLDKNVYVDEVVISSEIYEGEAIYDPRRIRLFVWEK